MKRGLDEETIKATVLALAMREGRALSPDSPEFSQTVRQAALLISEYLATLNASPAGEAEALNGHWVATNAPETAYRTWGGTCFVWTGDPNLATRYARREDVERTHAEDEGVWKYIQLPPPSSGEASAEEPQKQRRFRHRKRGSTYTELGEGRLQTSSPVEDMASVTIYRDDKDGTLWARPVAEFHDGRFEELS
ncbi:hypothetical protein ACMDCR_05095 [Labrys okinawensis]|uniref:hypothetical protein n=1 Tax=Labrys okinawensis TaxID=346911 RepID=UPI0039BD48B1